MAASKVTKTRLKNGLTVLLKEVHTAPLITWWVWYRVGSRHERPGHTGVSHWVEHMMFKGTRRFPGDVAEAALAHMVSNKTEAAYRRGKLLEKRRKLMDAWGSHCEGSQATVVRIVA